MEVRARLSNVRMGARKARLVADLVRGRPCHEALAILAASPRRAAAPIAKLIRSALANAEERNARRQAGLELDSLYVKQILIDQATHMWRIRPRAMGRATWVRKHQSHIRVVLDER
jgi:large subunit ribosomal protein L22